MKSKLLICLIILCIFSISAVSAADNQTELISNPSDTSLSVSNHSVISVSADYHPFSELNQSISQSSVELNLEHNYMYDGCVINVSNENKFTINGNGHIIDGLNGNPLIFDSKDIIVINNLTFQNAVNASLSVKSPVIFNNVTFMKITNYEYKSTIMGQDSIQFNECFFENVESSEYAFISCSRGNIVFKNSVCREGKFNQGFIVGEHNDGMSIENCTFENLSSHIGSASKFLNMNVDAAGGAIIAKFFPKNDTIIGDSFLIEECEFTNCTSSSNGGAIYCDLESGSNFLLKTFNIINTNFTNCKSKYGGAIVDLGDILNIINTTFENNVTV